MKMLGPARDEVTGSGKDYRTRSFMTYIVHQIKSRKMRWARHMARLRNGRDTYRVLVERPEGKRSLGIPRRKWEDNIKMALQNMCWGGVDWIILIQ